MEAAVEAQAPRARHRRMLHIRFWILLTFVGGWLSLPHIPLPRLALCAFQQVTGLPCPGCGMTRSVMTLASGDLVESLTLHPFGVALALLLLAATAASGLALVQPRDLLTEATVRHGPWIVAGIAVSLLLIWIVRAFIVPEWAPAPAGPFVPTFR